MDVDLSLTEGSAASASSLTIYTTDVNQSCNEYCSSMHVNMGCDSAALHNIVTNFASTIGSSQLCEKPLLMSCESSGAATGDSHFCYNTCDATNTGMTDYCNVKSDVSEYGNRFCVCSMNGGTAN